MPPRLSLRPQAQADLEEIVRFMANRNKDSEIAEEAGRKIMQRCQVAVDAPGAGTPFPTRAGIRKLVEGPCQIYYEVEEDGIVVLRIWDGRRGRRPRF